MEQIEYLKRLNTTGIQSFFALSRQAVDQFETMCDRQMAAGLAYMRETLDDAEALMTVSDGESLGQWNATHFRPGVQRLLGVAREQLGLSIKAQKEMAAAMQSRFMEMGRQTTEAIEQMGSQLPGGSKPLADAMRSMMSAVQEAMENMGRVTTQMGEMAEHEVAALAEAAGGEEADAVARRRRSA